MSRQPFGPPATVDGKAVHLYTLTNAKRVTARIATLGATLTELHVPDRDGRMGDVTLGFENLESYLRQDVFMGAVVGRVANRIRDAGFELEGKRYTLDANDPPHHLHGGRRGWDKVVWEARYRETGEGPSLRLTYVSPDGEEGYPGRVAAMVVYTLTHRNELRIAMSATSDRTTVVNMAHHGYWNLASTIDILDHELRLWAAHYTPGDPQVPTGVVAPVAGTPFDFTAGKPIGRDLAAAGGHPPGFDHNFVVDGNVDGSAGRIRPVARLYDPRSGRVMAVDADQPGVQLYTGNFLDGRLTGKGAVYGRYAGLCLETQGFPNAINVPGWRDQVILRSGRMYQHLVVHRFSTDRAEQTAAGEGSSAASENAEGFKRR